MNESKSEQTIQARRLVSDLLSALWRDKRFSFREIAQLSGMHFTLVSSYWNGRITPSMENLIIICRLVHRHCGADKLVSILSAYLFDQTTKLV